jgi:hypothetical protein
MEKVGLEHDKVVYHPAPDASSSLISSPKAPKHPVISGPHYEAEIRMQLRKCRMFPFDTRRKEQLIFYQPLKKFHAF